MIDRLPEVTKTKYKYHRPPTASHSLKLTKNREIAALRGRHQSSEVTIRYENIGKRNFKGLITC